MRESEVQKFKEQLAKGDLTVGTDGKTKIELTPEQRSRIKKNDKARREHDEGLVRSGQACPGCGSPNCKTHEALKNLPPGTPIVVVGVPMQMRPQKTATHTCLECGRPEEEHSEIMCPTPRWGIDGKDGE